MKWIIKRLAPITALIISIIIGIFTSKAFPDKFSTIAIIVLVINIVSFATWEIGIQDKGGK